MALKAGLEKTGKIDREAAVDGLEGIAIETPTGEMTVDTANHHVTLNMYLAKTEGEALTTVQALGPLAPQPAARDRRLPSSPLSRPLQGFTPARTMGGNDARVPTAST